MSEVVVYTTFAQAAWAQTALAAACRATGTDARLELFGSGSLYQRLRARRALPYPDIVAWFGAYASHAAASNGLLQAHQPAALPDSALRHPDWLWSAVDFEPFRVSGQSHLGNVTELASAPRVAMVDPERSEVGMALLMATLDRARQIEGDVERGWTFWNQRIAAGVTLVEDDDAALAATRGGRASHAVTLGERGTFLTGLAPLPHALGLAANAPNADAARRMLDWLLGQAAPQPTRLSAWEAPRNGLIDLLASAPPLDVVWCTQQYSATRQRWAQSGFGPSLGAT